MTREVIVTPHAPAAIGPYSQAIRAGNFIFTAGQIGLDPASGKLREGLEAQTRQALNNLQAILEAAGSSLQNVVKTTIFLTDINHFPTVNAVYGDLFSSNPPARSTVQVAALPLGALVEIEAIALVQDPAKQPAAR
jgi:2-iminobutanoate/2-iminopropanoate deaminase